MEPPNWSNSTDRKPAKSQPRQSNSFHLAHSQVPNTQWPLLSLGLVPLPVSSFSWQVSSGSSVSKLLESPRQSRLHFHSFTQWLLWASLQGQPCHMPSLKLWGPCLIKPPHHLGSLAVEVGYVSKEKSMVMRNPLSQAIVGEDRQMVCMD